MERKEVKMGRKAKKAKEAKEKRKGRERMSYLRIVKRTVLQALTQKR